MKRYIKTGCLCLLIAVVLLASVPMVPQLSVTNEDNGSLLISRHIRPGDQFSVSYIHSVNKSKVTDTFIITSEYKIMLDSTAFSAYGAGIPEPEEGQVLIIDKDEIKIEHLNRLVDPYRLFIGTTADHTIHIHGEKPLHLTDFADPQTSVIIDINNVSIIKNLINL